MGGVLVAGTAGCAGTKVVRGDLLELAVSPAQNGGAAVPPDRPITVRAKNGTVQNVTVTSAGEQMIGDASPDRTSWQSRWTLTPSADYQVTVTGLGRDGRTRTITSKFRTAKAGPSLASSLEAPNNRETVGVGMPVILNFASPVTDRAAVERGLEIQSSKPAEGAWHWFGDQTVVFRTRRYWPAHTDVTFRTHLAGVRVAKNLWGGKNQTVRFRVGDEHISKASAKSHYMVVMKNGRKVRRIPVSMGMGGSREHTTTNGVHLTMEKANPVIMDSSTTGCGPGCPGYYRQTVYSAVRISNSGEYVHAAPWSVGSQGNSNVSHGCVNASDENAAWFYKFSYRGDPYTITGTSRELEPDNGWGYWQLSWTKWLKGSALNKSSQTGPRAGAPAAEAGANAGGGGGTPAGSEAGAVSRPPA
ncbi:L,D-transpeptidase [Actinomadura rayongensis]|uniref:L,D-transpeptidase family protein n=1 Tax=Actinomadura rayongensis TaxID=1429076 RepID=A0A6I4W340_9ACTN|nr:Ig-like domain-containing protein [Actinomadura rayongensis]MXQ63893.1 L,D-transpeptidase family protein [Actinomadura rayongensis]